VHLPEGRIRPADCHRITRPEEDVELADLDLRLAVAHRGCSRSSPTSWRGSATVRCPARDFGGPRLSVSNSITDAETLAVAASRSTSRRVGTINSPHRSPVKPAITERREPLREDSGSGLGVREPGGPGEPPNLTVRNAV
jgi:hypothetical protein